MTEQVKALIRLALAYAQQADMLRKSGELQQAVDHYKKAASIYLELSEEEPSVLELLAQTIETAAVTYKEAGDLKSASETMAEAISVREKMVQAAARE